MAKISAFLCSSSNICMLVLTFTFLVCEIVVGQISRSLLIAVDSFHTLYISINMALSAPKSSITNPHLLCTCMSKQHKSVFCSPCLPSSSTTPGPSLPNISLPADPALGSMESPSISLDGDLYSRMRLKPFGVLISTLLLASQCVSISLEIFTHLLQPEAIQYPYLSIMVGATSLLFNLLVLTWRRRNRGMYEAANEIKLPQLIKTDPQSTSKSKEVALQDEALMFCNRDAPSVLDLEQSSHDCSSSTEIQNQHTAEPVSDLNHTQISSSSFCESSQMVLQPTDQLYEEPKSPTCTDHTMPPHDQAALCTAQNIPVGSRFRRLQRSCIRHLISVMQNLLGSVLILVNGLVLLLVKPHCHHRHSDCNVMVYLDACFSIAVVLILLVTALPKLYHYGMLALQATPLHLDINQVKYFLALVPGVLSVHELHVWQLSDECMVASVHVHCPERLNAAECSDVMVKITEVLRNFGINHCTVQLEFHPLHRVNAVNSDGAGQTMKVNPACSLRCGQECAEKLCCSPEEDRSSSPKKGLSSAISQEESFCSPSPFSVDRITDVIIENTYL